MCNCLLRFSIFVFVFVFVLLLMKGLAFLMRCACFSIHEGIDIAISDSVCSLKSCYPWGLFMLDFVFEM